MGEPSLQFPQVFAVPAKIAVRNPRESAVKGFLAPRSTSPLAAPRSRPRIPRRQLLVQELRLREQRALRMMFLHVPHIRRVIRRTNDAPDHRVNPVHELNSSPQSPVPSHSFALLPFGPIVVSNRLKMRPYSSVQLAGRTNPWFSTGYDASHQFVLPSSISRSSRRTMSW